MLFSPPQPHLDKLAAPNLGGLWAHGTKHGQLAAAGKKEEGGGGRSKERVHGYCAHFSLGMQRAPWPSIHDTRTHDTHSHDTR